MIDKPVAIVVGVGAELGLGAALCRRFAEGGHHVLVAGRSADKIEQVVRTIASKGGSAEAVPTEHWIRVRRLLVEISDLVHEMFAVGMRARVTVFDKNPARLEELDREFNGRLETVYSTSAAIAEVVRTSRGVGVPGPTVLVVVISVASLDVVGERLRDVAVLPVTGDDVGHVVADHAAEPAALVTHVLPVIAHVVGRGHAERDRRRVPTDLRRRLADGADHPAGHVDVGELEDEAVAHLSCQLEGPRPVGGHPDLER